MSINPCLAQDFDYKLYDNQDGLSENRIIAIDKTSTGEIYVLTSLGIDFFDGFSFKHLDLHPDYTEFSGFAIDSNDILWTIPNAKSGKTNPDESNIICFDIKSRELILPEKIIPDPDSIFYKTDYYHVTKNFFGEIQLIAKGLSHEIENRRFKFTNNYTTRYLMQGNHYVKVLNLHNPNSTFYPKSLDEESPVFRLKSHFTHLPIDSSPPIYIEKDSSLYFEGDRIFENSILGTDSILYFSLRDKDFFYNAKLTNEALLIDTLDLRKIISKNTVTSTLQISPDEFWIGSTQGLIKASRSKLKYRHQLGERSFREVVYLSNDSILLNSYYGYFIYEPSRNNLSRFHENVSFYAAAQMNNRKLLFGGEDSCFKITELDSPNFELQCAKSFGYFLDIYKLPDGDFLCTTNNGVCRISFKNNHVDIERITTEKFNYNTHTFCRIQEKNKIAVTHNAGLFLLDIETFECEELSFWNQKNITYVYQDEDDLDVYWIGTSAQGLYKWNRINNEIKHWDNRNGLSNSKVHSIIEDNQDRLWISTNFGINCLHKYTFEIVQFFNQESSPVTEFNRSSSLKLKDGSIIFGSINGFVHFDPNFDLDQTFNSNIDIVKYSYLWDNETYEINSSNNYYLEIPKKHNDLKLYLQPNTLEERAVYKYSIPGITKDWKFTSTGLINLEQLNTGEHTLYLSKKISERNWSEGKEFKIFIKPPFYLNIWFWVLSLIALLVLIVYLINQRTKRILKRNALIKKEVKAKTEQIVVKNEQLQHMNQTNEILFNILSHDLRTPLTSMANIGGTLNQMIKEKDDRAMQIGSTIEERSKHLLDMLNNLLDWTQIQKNMGSFVFSEIEIEPLIITIIVELTNEASKKGIKVHFKPNGKFNKVVSDEEALKIVMRNVLSNAIKFSDEKGNIEITFDNDHSIINIKDDAGGIPKHIIELLNSNQQIHSSKNKYGQVGLGIGLQISNYLIHNIGGKLDFEIIPNKGTTTKIVLKK